MNTVLGAWRCLQCGVRIENWGEESAPLCGCGRVMVPVTRHYDAATVKPEQVTNINHVEVEQCLNCEKNKSELVATFNSELEKLSCEVKEKSLAINKAHQQMTVLFDANRFFRRVMNTLSVLLLLSIAGNLVQFLMR